MAIKEDIMNEYIIAQEPTQPVEETTSDSIFANSGDILPFIVVALASSVITFILSRIGLKKVYDKEKQEMEDRFLNTTFTNTLLEVKQKLADLNLAVTESNNLHSTLARRSDLNSIDDLMREVNITIKQNTGKTQELLTVVEALPSRADIKVLNKNITSIQE